MTEPWSTDLTHNLTGTVPGDHWGLTTVKWMSTLVRYRGLAVCARVQKNGILPLPVRLSDKGAW